MFEYNPLEGVEHNVWHTLLYVAIVLTLTGIPVIVKHLLDYKQRRKIDELISGQEVVVVQMNELYCRYTNHLSLGPAIEILKIHYYVILNDIVGEVNRIYYENNIHDPKREQVIRATFPRFVRARIARQELSLQDLKFVDKELRSLTIAKCVDVDGVINEILDKIFDPNETETKDDILGFVKSVVDSQLTKAQDYLKAGHHEYET